MTGFTFRTAPRIHVETGGLSQVGKLFAELGCRRVLIVTDRGIVGCGFADIALKSLADVGLEAAVFDGIVADPPVAVVEAGVAAARDLGADGVLGLGGGSSLDAAKVVALAANTDQTIENMFGIDKTRGERLKMILAPTTSGTGSEVTWVSVLTSGANLKSVIYSPVLLPDIALLDAALTLGMPRHITAATALDAMVHAVEGYTSRTKKNLMADAMAEKALGLLGTNFRAVLADPSNAVVREKMLLGATLAGMAFVNASVAAVHGLSYPLGARFHIPHGHGNALVMASVFRFNLRAAEAMYAELASALLPGRSFNGPRAAAEALIDELDAMFIESGLEGRLSKLGISEADLPVMAEDVVINNARLIASNPCDMSYDDVLGIYRSIY